MKKAASLIIAVLAVAAAVTASPANAQAKEGQSKTNVTGTWKLTIETPNGPGGPTVVFKQEGEELTGTYKGRFGDAPLKGTVKGNDIKFTVKVNAQGQEVLVEYAGTVDGDTMKGKVKFGEFGEGNFSGKKE